jgi:hypothetical protein
MITSILTLSEMETLHDLNASEYGSFNVQIDPRLTDKYVRRGERTTMLAGAK